MNVPENLKNMFSESLRKKKNRKYNSELRKFAVTLQFYSTRAYNYVGKVWNNLLPHTSTIRKWYSNVDGKPGFSKEAITAIKMKNSDKQLFLNIVLDEMSIRSQIMYKNNEFFGVVDLGTNLPKTDTTEKATSAFVLMAVAINSSWKIPLGYFLIKSLSGSERANILLKALELLHETNAKVTSVTFDGAPSNMRMCSVLGASFDVYGRFKPSFNNPYTNEKILVFLDPCHLIKLVRNSLGDKKVLRYKNKIIKWEYIEKIYNFQIKEGLHSANKLTKKHIIYSNNRMNVKLAAQTLSESVYSSFQHFTIRKIEEFEGCEATAEFCLIFNNIFDIMNCRNKLSKKNK